jgi:cytochrome c oxidase subunit 2
VNFSLKSADVLHSFSMPRLGGKRDLITNHENFLWMTPDSVGETALNGMCAEYCGASHANMRLKVFVVTPANFVSWAQNQQKPAAFGAVAAPAPPPAPGASGAPPAGVTPAVAVAPAMPGMAGHDMSAMTAPGAAVQQAGFTSFPHDKLPDYVKPKTPLPEGMIWNESLKGDANRGRDFMTKGGGSCLGCHTIRGNPSMMGVIGPNLTHVASRTTIAAGLYPNDTKHLALWIKNARFMKPGSLMPTLGAFQRDPITKTTVPQTGLSDQQIADIVAYLQALK